MATLVPLSDGAKTIADDLVRSGRFQSVEAAIEAGLSLLTGEAIDFDELPPEHRAAIEEGIADVEAGRVYDAEEVFASLRARYEAMAKER